MKVRRRGDLSSILAFSSSCNITPRPRGQGRLLRQGINGHRRGERGAYRSSTVTRIRVPSANERLSRIEGASRRSGRTTARSCTPAGNRSLPAPRSVQPKLAMSRAQSAERLPRAELGGALAELVDRALPIERIAAPRPGEVPVLGELVSGVPELVARPVRVAARSPAEPPAHPLGRVEGRANVAWRFLRAGFRLSGASSAPAAVPQRASTICPSCPSLSIPPKR